MTIAIIIIAILYLGGIYQNKLAFDLCHQKDGWASPHWAVIVSSVCWPVIVVLCFGLDLYDFYKRRRNV